MVSKNPSADEVQRWGPSEVAEWLAQIGLEDCVRFFQDRNVTGAELLALDESQLFRWQDLPIKRRREVAKHIETLKSKKQEKKSKFSLFSKKPQLPSKDYQHEPTTPDDDEGWSSDEFDDTLTTMRQESIEWQECLDENGFKYYWNITTNETSWDRPDKFLPVDSGTQEDEEDASNDYEPPPDAVSPQDTQPPHRRQPMPLPTQSTEDQETYEVPDHDNDSGGSDYEEPMEEQQPPVPHRPPVNKPPQQTLPPARANKFNVNVAERRMPPLPGRQQKPALASQPQPEDTYEEFAESGGPEEEYEMPMQGGPEEEYEVPDSESFSSGRLPQSTVPPVLGRKPLPPPPDEEPPPALPPKPTKPGPTSHMTTMNKVLPNPTPDSRQAPKVPTSAKSTRPPPLPSPSTKPESPFTGGPPNFPTKKPQVTSPLASGQKSGAKWPPADASSNVRPSQLKNVGKQASSSSQPSLPKWKQNTPETSSPSQPSLPKWKQNTPETSSPPQPSLPKWKQTPPAVPSQGRTPGVNRIASQFEAKQEAPSPKSPGPVKNKVSGIASMFEKQNLHLSPASSPPSGSTRSPHRSSPRTSTLSVASTTSSSSAASSGSADSFLDKRASHSSASSASGDSIHDELLPGQRPGGPGGVPALPVHQRGKPGSAGTPPPPPPIASIPSTKAKSRDIRSRQLPATPPSGARGPPPPSIQAKKPVPSMPLPEPEPLQGGLYEFPWYHGEVEQRQASAALREYGKDGAFLIRKSTRDPTRPYTLALIYQRAIKKVQIRYRSDQKYALGTEKEDEDTFYSIPDLIEFHQTHDILLSQGGKTKLTEAVYKNY
ncbi:lymphocyte cytosolic protein 2-like [Branchiostoma lanceolatum]|uniref:lymphocyte cytosolic protein 2-like n=1 Tax=Branchiostoma lanceolatum TaxID=7740 RepID=UPI003453B2D8